MDDAMIDSIVSSVMELQNKENTNLPLYEKQLRETETGIQNMLNAIQAGILTSSTKERLEALETQKKELEAKIAEERLAKPKLSEDFVRFWLTGSRGSAKRPSLNQSAGRGVGPSYPPPPYLMMMTFASTTNTRGGRGRSLLRGGGGGGRGIGYVLIA